MKFKLTFNSERCKGCGLCINFCPKKILAFDTGVFNGNGVHPVYMTDQASCIGCQSCALMCPDAIITIEKLEESA